uniref:Reverse transcriptase domain-containing protein n=1 Tax=Strongyloides stercoralis TaxID=6248 RepID=A0AAF5DM59_STRER
MEPIKKVIMDPGGTKSMKRPVSKCQNTNLEKIRTEPPNNGGNNVVNENLLTTEKTILMKRGKSSILNNTKTTATITTKSDSKKSLKEYNGEDNRNWKKWTDEERRLLREFAKICPIKNDRFQYKQVAKEFNLLMTKMNGRSAARVQSEIKAISTGINRHIPNYAAILKTPEKINKKIDSPILLPEKIINNEEKINKDIQIISNKSIKKIPKLRCNVNENAVDRFDIRKYIPFDEINKALNTKLNPIIKMMNSKMNEKEWSKLQREAKKWLRAALFTMKSYCFKKIDQDGFRINGVIKARKYERRVMRLRERIKKANKLVEPKINDQKYANFYNREKAFIRAYCKRKHYQNEKIMLQAIDEKFEKVKNEKIKIEKSNKAAKIRYLFNQKPSLKVLSYVDVNNKNETNINIPCEKVSEYYRNLYSKPEVKETPLFNEYIQFMKNNDAKKNSEKLNWIFDDELFNLVVSKANNFKTTGWDNIQTVVFKKLDIAKSFLKIYIKNVLNGSIPILKTDVTTKGFMLYKGKGDKNTPENYRLICCSNSDYKILRSYLYKYLYQNIGNWIAKEQKAGRENKISTLDCLIIDATVNQELNLSNMDKKYATYIDLSKAFDKVNNTLLIKLSKSTRLPKNLVEVISKCQKLQKIKIQNIKGNCSISLLRGVGQGDALSPLLFQLIFSSISYYLNKTSSIQNNHIVFMDDLKWYSMGKNELEAMIEILMKISNEIGMEVNRSKCAIVELNGAKNTIKENELDFTVLNSFYKYLGIYQNKNGYSDMTCTLNNVVEKSLLKVKEILASPLNSSQVIKAINTTIIPAISYILLGCHGQEDMKIILKNAENIDSMIRRLMTKSHNPDYPLNHLRDYASCKSRLYLSNKSFGLGLKEIKMEVWKNIGFAGTHLLYEKDLEEHLGRQMEMHKMNKKNLYSHFLKYLELMGVKIECMGPKEYKLNGEIMGNEVEMRSYLKNKFFELSEKENLDKWSSKMNYAKSVVNQNMTMPWLRNNPLCQQKTREMFQLQQEDYPGLTHTKKNPNQKCLYCNMFDTCRHISSQCQSEEMISLFKRRHDRVLMTLFNELRKKYKLKPLNRKEALDPNNWKLTEDIMIHFEKPWAFNDLHHYVPDLIIECKEKVYVIELGITSLTNYQRVKDYKTTKYTINGTLEINELNFNEVSKGKNLVDLLKVNLKKQIIFIPLILGSYGEIMDDLLDNLKNLDIIDTMPLARCLSISTVLETLCVVKNYIARRYSNN